MKSPTRALLEDICQLESSLKEVEGEKESKDTWLRLLGCLSLPDVIETEFQTRLGTTYSGYKDVIVKNSDMACDDAHMIWKLRCSLSHNYLVSQPLRNHDDPVFILDPEARDLISKESDKYRVNNRILCDKLKSLAEKVLDDFEADDICRRDEAKILRTN